MSSLPRGKYSGTAMALHWLIAVLIVCAFALGWIMTDIPGFTPTKLRYFSYHKWIGVTVLLLVVIRVIWRATHRPPPLPEGSGPGARLMNTVAHGTHHLLYLLMLAVPISGYLYSSAAGIQVVYLGILPLPTIIAPHPAWRHTMRDIHVWLDWTIAAFVALHVLAVIKHQVLDRDGLLKRMLPFGD